jgi:hypothetical protein
MRFCQLSRIGIIMLGFASATSCWGQTNSATASSIFGLSANQATNAPPRASFRPAPTPGQSQLGSGRSLNLRDRGSQGPQLYLYTPPGVALAQSAVRRARTAQSLAQLRATRQAQSLSAAQALRPVGGRRSTGAGHKLTLGFDEPAPTPLYLEKEAARQGRSLAFLESKLEASQLRMEKVGNRAILTGKVPSEDRARLAERLARLEPGIYEVDNMLEIAP